MPDGSARAARVRGSLCILGSALLYGSYGTWSRLLGPHFANFFQCTARSVLVALLLLPVVAARGALRGVGKPDRGWFVVFLGFTAATQAPVYYAYNHMDIGTATLLFYVTMLMTMSIVGVVFLGETLTRLRLAAFLIACAGMYVTFSFSLSRFAPLAAVMACLNGIASGGELAFSKKLTGRYPSSMLAFWSWVMIAAVSLACSLALHEPWTSPAPALPWLTLAGFALASLFAFGLVLAGLAQVEAGIGALLGLLEVPFGVGFGILVFHERLTSRVLLGGGLIVLAAVLPHLGELESWPARGRPGRRV